MSDKIIVMHGNEEIYLDLSRTYQASGSNQVAIQAFTMEHEPWATMTTCIPHMPLAENETVLDTNNMPEILKILGDAGVIKDTGKVAKSGHCTYPVVEVLKRAA